jgi:hypothetical protein
MPASNLCGADKIVTLFPVFFHVMLGTGNAKRLVNAVIISLRLVSHRLVQTNMDPCDVFWRVYQEGSSPVISRREGICFSTPGFSRASDPVAAKNYATAASQRRHAPLPTRREEQLDKSVGGRG